MPARLFYGSIAAITTCVFILDQMAKSAVERKLSVGEVDHFWGPIDIALVYNPALAFGATFISGKGIYLLLALSTLFFLFMIFWLPRTPYTLLAGGFIFGGGVSNFYDRISGTGVVDYIYLGSGSPVFNLADVSITIGIILFVYYTLIRAYRDMQFQAE